MAESDGEDTFRKRLRKLKDGLHFEGWGPMAEELQSLTGLDTKANHLSGWQTPPGPGLMAGLALLHPADPRGCLKWLREGGEMPRLHVDRNEQEQSVAELGANHGRDLEVMSAVNQLAVEVAEILGRKRGVTAEGEETGEGGPEKATPAGGVDRRDGIERRRADVSRAKKERREGQRRK